ERKDRQHVVDRLANPLYPARAPGPYRRADEVHDRHAGSAHPLLDVEIEVGCIDTEEDFGMPVDEAALEVLAHPAQAGVRTQDLRIAVDREGFDVPPAIEADGRHRRAADTPGVQPALGFGKRREYAR